MKMEMHWEIPRKYKTIFVVCFLTELCIVVSSPEITSPKKNINKPDGQLTTPELIVKYGYPAETHEVLTADGYILTMHRIPGGYGKPVAILQHGLLGSSADWVMSGPNKALGYTLYNAGYDVWLGNARGCKYSRKHQWLTTKDKPFWNFSFHEMGIYDMPAMIDYVLQITGQPYLYYVGHSMGTTMFYIMTSLLPEYNNKVRVSCSLAPAAFYSKESNILFRLSEYSGVGAVPDKLYNSDFLPNMKIMNTMAQRICSGVFLQNLCQFPITLIGGLSTTQLNKTMLPTILSHFPAGSSLKSWIHYGQLCRSGKFRQYDHGKELNIKYYGTPEPPEYNLTAITTPITLHAAKGDSITTVKNSRKIDRALRSSLGVFVVPVSTFNHFDFLWGIDAHDLVYNLLIAIMNKFR